MSKSKSNITHVELTAHRPLSQRTTYSQRCDESKSDSGKCPPDLGGSGNLTALILGPFASKCIATSSYVSEDSKEIKHAVDNAENFKQAKQRNRKEESSNSTKKHSSATDGS